MSQHSFQNLLFLSLSIQKQSELSTFQVQDCERIAFLLHILASGDVVKRKEQGSLSSSHQKDRERRGWRGENFISRLKKEKKKVKQGIFFLAPKKALEA